MNNKSCIERADDLNQLPGTDKMESLTVQYRP
ncbi:hypothetical protein FH603_1037 [Spirosoma sp. LMG 31447]|uniref:Uncharacterized protein n=1 Tax=Spirosoma utsteinense TaxID=2585773 RepID=A0ABR6W288_9BACT|nr:hypothetical protein [Spirosoma utsteinense]